MDWKRKRKRRRRKGKGAPRRIGVLSNVFSLRKKREVKDSSEEAA